MRPECIRRYMLDLVDKPERRPVVADTKVGRTLPAKACRSAVADIEQGPESVPVWLPTVVGRLGRRPQCPDLHRLPL